jgi:hypothetical protein
MALAVGGPIDKTPGHRISFCMIRKIAEHHQSYRRLMALAKKAAPERRERLEKLARLGLKLAQLQLRDPSHRPDTKSRMSADQYRAIAECLSAAPDMIKRAKYFASMAETAEWDDWPSSATAPCLLLTTEELDVIANAPYWSRQRVLAPFLTATEQAALRQSTKDAAKLFRQAFAVDRKPSPSSS